MQEEKREQGERQYTAKRKEDGAVMGHSLTNETTNPSTDYYIRKKECSVLLYDFLEGGITPYNVRSSTRGSWRQSIELDNVLILCLLSTICSCKHYLDYGWTMFFF